MHKNKDGRYLPLTPEQAQSLSEAMQTKLQDVKNIMLGLPPSATQEDCDNYVLQLKNDYKSAFKDAYGTKELTILSEEYINAQQKGVGYINMGVTVGAIALAVFTGGATATIATAVAMTQPMQILEKATDSKGFTDQDWQEYEKMLISQIPWMAAGMGMGKIGDIARSCVKLKGLQSVAQQAGQSLDDYINTVAKAGNLPDDVAKTLKSTRVLAETAGVSTEFALDIATTLAVYRDIKSEDWLMALAGALAGSKMNAKLAQMGTPNAKAQFLMDTFKELKLTPDEANKILKAMDKIVDETSLINDISEGLELVTDDTIKKEIMAKTKDIELSEMTKQEKVKALIEQRQLVDAYNNLKGNYVTLDSQYCREYVDFLAKFDPELQKTIRGEDFEIELPQHIKDLEKKYEDASNDYIDTIKNLLNKEFEEFKESQRVEQFVDYCKNHNDEVSQYMYEEVYLKDCDFAPEIKQRLVDINRQYGVKIFPNKNLGNDAERCLKYIERELTAWKIASNGTAKYPPVIDFTISKRDYIDDKSAFGQSVTAGFSESHANGAISLDGMTYKQVKHAFRHELMHSNDLKRLSHFEEGFVVKEDGKIVAQKCKFYDDFVKLGITEYHIPYAYNNPKEFIAVAAESTKLNECSPEFKQTLIDFGMPEWMFDVKYDEDAWMLDFEL